MSRLLRIEFLKLKSYWPFWILAGLYVFITVGGGLVSQLVIDGLSTGGSNAQGMMLSQMPIFDFKDLWQNLTWTGRVFLPVLAFLVVISTYNEINFNTLKQNIIDGMSRKEWLISKVLLLIILAVIASVLQLITGFIIGFKNAPSVEWDYAVQNIVFVPAFMLQVITFLSLALLLTVLLKRSILSFGVLLIFYFPGEVIIRWILPDTMEPLFNFFPIKGLLNLIHFPFDKYIGAEGVQDFVSFKEVVIAIAQTISYWLLSFWIIRRRDL